MANALKAYAVLEKDEYTGDVYFAKHSIVAAKAGANEYGDGELSYVQCRRAPWADVFVGKGVPAKVAVDHGWRFECHGCGITIDQYLEDEHRLPVSGVVGSMHGAVYCCARCKWRRIKSDARRKREETAAIEDFKAIVRARFPDVAFADEEPEFRGHHAYVMRADRSDFWHRRQVIVAFRFPGMKIGPAHFRLEDYHRIGPPVAGYTCCNGDREAFEAYAATTRKGAS
ncbi:hypothetical protein [Rhizobium sp. AN80A]|uniref:hypothetical protein n=1 Tax=Rhizobium sp. AN80A TaxID=3040673 RepID=UPI0024B3C926|nr:hypothetical protein [Rhizobium sp. AN80A]